MWQGRFGRAPDAIGKTLLLENVPFTIVGVAPAGFYGVEVGRQNDIWIPLESERRIRRPSYTSSSGVAIVNQTFAERYFGNGSPIGKTITARGTPMEIIVHRSCRERQIFR